MKKRGFTLLELLYATIVFSIIFGTLFTLFLRIIRSKSEIEARQSLIQTTYDIVEQINNKLQNYTIDYEEYFNRTNVWCMSNTVQSTWFVWNITWWTTWHCTMWTAYGNQSPFFVWYGNHVDNYLQHKLYVCSSDITLVNWNVYWTTAWAFSWERLIMPYDLGDLWCVNQLYNEYIAEPSFALYWFRQPFGAYEYNFLDVKGDVDDVLARSGDDDDTNNWLWPVAIRDNQNIKELYVISKDKKKRIFFRRKLISTWDWDNSAAIDQDNERLYTIQMLQLKAFDAWQNHDFDATTYRGVFDGVTDTWACDYEAGFVCNWSWIWAIYSWYRLPNNLEDWWINLLNTDISVADWNMQIYPIKDLELSWWENQYQTNPFIRFYIKTTVFWQNRAAKLWAETLDEIYFDVQTSFNIKSNY